MRAILPPLLYLRTFCVPCVTSHHQLVPPPHACRFDVEVLHRHTALVLQSGPAFYGSVVAMRPKIPVPLKHSLEMELAQIPLVEADFGSLFPVLFGTSLQPNLKCDLCLQSHASFLS